MSIVQNDKSSPASLSTQTVPGAALTLFAGTAISKVLGFVRDVLTSLFFGASAAMDAFLVALSIPSIIGYALGTSLSTALMPVSTRMQRAPEKDLRQLNRSIVIVATATALALMIAVIVGARPLISFIAPELPGGTVDTTVVLTRLLSLLIIGYVLYYLATGIYHARNHFVTPSCVQPAENIIVIVVLLALQAFLGIKALILATLAGVLGTMTLMLISLMRNGEFTGTGGRVQEETAAVLKGSAPLVVVYCFYQGYFLIERYFASGLPAGSISSLTYARRIIELPTIFFVSTLSAAMYPRLTSLFISGDRQAVTALLLSATTKLLYVLVPITLALLVWSREVVTLVFHRGAFDANAVRSTSAALFYYSMGLFPLSGMVITSRILYAMNNMRVPFIASVLGVVVCILSNLLLKTTLGIGGIALATSLMFLCIYAVQTAYLHHRGIDFRIRETTALLFKVLACSGVALIGPLVMGSFAVNAMISMLVFIGTYLGLSFLLLRMEMRKLLGRRFPLQTDQND